jgi:hypothetical protein
VLPKKIETTQLTTTYNNNTNITNSNWTPFLFIMGIGKLQYLLWFHNIHVDVSSIGHYPSSKF